MAEPTTTLTALRRLIAGELQMPFAKRYSAGYLDADTGGSTTTFVDSMLTQKDNYWSGSWFYRTASQEVSLIRSFTSADNKGLLEVPVTSVASGDDYEIHTFWNAYDIHRAINRAISDAGRIWPNTVTDETLILQTDKLDYDLTGLATRPWIVAQIFIENRSNVKRGVAVSGGGSTITVESSSILSDVTTAANWRVSIYEGTGAGQIRTGSSVSGAQLTVSSAWTTQPDSTSKYALWDATEDMKSWPLLDTYRLDAKEYPSTLYLAGRYTSHYGMRIRIEYMAMAAELSAEADTTIIPSQYIVPKAISYLYGQVSPDTKVDREVYKAEGERYKKQADEYLALNAPHKPDITLRRPNISIDSTIPSDPLGWRNY